MIRFPASPTIFSHMIGEHKPPDLNARGKEINMSLAHGIQKNIFSSSNIDNIYLC